MIIDWYNHKIIVKIVYYGPAMSGKTTTIRGILKKFGQEDVLQSLETTTGRTLFFDFGFITKQNGDWTIMINLWSATGQDYYIATRESVLKGVDGVIFVADASPNRIEHNKQSWGELQKFLLNDISNIPVVIALNKVDINGAIDEKTLINALKIDTKNHPIFKTIAKDGMNIMLPLKVILKEIFKLINT
ncbi:MAG: GTP-binding protein [Candidatus Asgardarchaeia archaeon]